MNVFLAKVAEILEVDSVTPDFRFRDAADWDSMKGFSLMVLLESDYGRPMSVGAFLESQTVADLARFAGVA